MARTLARAQITGPCSLNFGGIDVGHTVDGVVLTAARELTDVTVDQFGNTPIDKVLSGNGLSVKFKMAQADWDQWNVAIPETSSYDGAGTKDRNDFGADAGYSLRQDAKPLIIHPLKNQPGDLSQDVTIYLAVSSDDVELPMKIDDQAVLEVTMTGLVSEAYGTGRRLGHYGPADVS